MPQNPGATLRLQVAGGQIGAAPAPALTATGGPVSPSNQVVEDGAMTAPVPDATQPYPTPLQATYINPGVSYYGSPYYGSPYYGSYFGPVVSLGLVVGYHGGGRYYGGRGGHGHRR